MAQGEECNNAKTSGRSYDTLWRALEGQKYQDHDGQTQTSVSWAGRPPFPPTLPHLLASRLSPARRPLIDADGRWRCRNSCASLWSFPSLRFMPIPHEQLGSLLYSWKPSAGVLSSPSPPFEFHSKDQHTLLQISHPLLLLPPWVARTPNKVPKHHPLWQTLLPHTCWSPRWRIRSFSTLVQVSCVSSNHPQLLVYMLLWGRFLVHKLTCGNDGSVSEQNSMRNRKAVGLLNPMRDKSWRQEPGGGRDDTCGHGLSRTGKRDVCKKKKKNVVRIPWTISSVFALSPPCSRKLSWKSRRRTIGWGLLCFPRPRHRRSME